MSDRPRFRLRAGHRHPRRAAAAAVVSLAVVGTGLGVAPTSTAAPAGCDTAVPVDSLTRGDAVTGLTVTSGSTPESFDGEILGVVQDGIAPGLDMIMADMTSSTIDEVGIWQGMSGSPVYDDSGDLIGAVAYGLAWGPSSIAGITPAADMLELLDTPAAPAARRTLRRAATQDTVAVPPRLARAVASTGEAAADEASEGLSRLPMPVAVSGVSQERMSLVRKSLDLGPGVRVKRATSGVAADADPGDPIVPGGNLASSLSYGDISALGVGTATIVCDGKVVAFGHPMTFGGTSTMSMHNADAVHIQPDPVGPGFKVANASAPLGTITQDRLAGIFGPSGALPDYTDVSSSLTAALSTGPKSRDGLTRISEPDYVPDLVATHLLANQDRVFDAIGAGSSRLGWTITGTREGGRTFEVSRTDKFVSEWDISFEGTWDLYDALYRITQNDVEDVTITDVTQTGALKESSASWKVAEVRMHRQGAFRPVPARRPILVRPGVTRYFRVTLNSRELGTRKVFIPLTMPRDAGRKSGMIEILGGNSYFDESSFDDFFFGDFSTGPSKSLDQIIESVESAPRNDRVLAKVTFFGKGRPTSLSQRPASTVVNGGKTFQVQSLGKRGRRR